MPLIEWFYNEWTPRMILIAETELGETEETKKICIKKLKELIRGEPDFNPCTEDAFLLRFLRGRKFNVDKAFKSLLKYYMYKASYSGIITDFKPSDVIPVLLQDNFTILRYRGQKEILVALLRFEKFDVDKFTADQGISSVFVCCDILMQFEVAQILGYSLIVDFAGITLKMARKWSSPRMLYRLVSGVLDYIPSRIKAYHIVNQPFYCDIFFKFMIKFVSEKLKKRLYFHGSDLKSLHQYIPPDILPEELGGIQGPNSICAEQFRSLVISHEDYVIKMNKYGYQGKTLNNLRKEKLNMFGF